MISAHFSEIFFLTLRKDVFSSKMVLYVGFVGNPGSGLLGLGICGFRRKLPISDFGLGNF